MTDTTYASLRDRAVLISGGATGIGASIVSHFAAQGARVAFVDIQQEPALALAEHLAAEGHTKPHFVHCDLRDIEAYQAAIAGIAAQLGGIDVLVNNAAHDDRHDWKTVTPEYWENRMQVNLRHQFFAIQSVAPLMQAQKRGSIINFGSISWHLKSGGMPAYTSAKAAVEGLTRSFARDLGPDGIRVNLVAAGPIRTMAAKSIPGFDDFEEVWSTRAPLAWDLDDPVPAARACVALLSDWFPATTGEIVHVDGGVHSQGA